MFDAASYSFVPQLKATDVRAPADVPLSYERGSYRISVHYDKFVPLPCLPAGLTLANLNCVNAYTSVRSTTIATGWKAAVLVNREGRNAAWLADCNRG